MSQTHNLIILEKIFSSHILYNLYMKTLTTNHRGRALEIRKLQKIKGGSFTLSLPRQWIEERRLKGGDQMTVSQEEDGSLRIFPMGIGIERSLEVTLSLEDYPNLRALEYCVATYYIQGSNRINIVSTKIISADEKKRLKHLRTELPGVEVAEEEANRLTFQVLIDPASFALESLIQKTLAFSLKLQEDAVKSLIDWNLPLAKEVQERSSEAQRHYRVMIRQVALASLSRLIADKIGVRNCQECVTFALVARDLSRLVYHSSSIARHVLKFEAKRKFDSETLEAIAGMSEVTHEMQNSAAFAFLRKDVKLAISVLNRMADVREKEEALLKNVMEKVKDVDAAITLSINTYSQIESSFTSV
jgi:phosphate uptake regulator